jgi:hypothetical protein
MMPRTCAGRFAAAAYSEEFRRKAHTWFSQRPRVISKAEFLANPDHAIELAHHSSVRVVDDQGKVCLVLEGGELFDEADP